MTRSPPNPAFESHAKASEDNGATAQAMKVPADSMTGEASRASVGAGTDAPIRTMSMTPLRPRELGGLKGFGFTVNFEDSPPAPVSRMPVSSLPAAHRAGTKAAGVTLPASAASICLSEEPHPLADHIAGGAARTGIAGELS